MKRALLSMILCAACAACATGDRAASARPGSYLAVLNKDDATIYIVEPNSGHVKDSAPVGTGPHEAAASNDGRQVIVCNYGDQTPGHTLSIFDLFDRRVVETVDLSPYTRPHGIVFLDRRSTVLVTSETSHALLEVDLRKKEVVRTIDTGAELSHMVDITPDGKRAFTANITSGSVSAIDLESGKLLRVIPTGNGAEAIDVSPDGSEVWVGHNVDHKIVILDAESLEKKCEFACGEVPIRLKFTPDGKTVVVACAGSGDVALIDARERREIARLPVELHVAGDAEKSITKPTPVGVLIDPRGRYAFIALTAAKKIAVIDIAERRVSGHFEVGNGPDGMAWAYPREWIGPSADTRDRELRH